MPRIPYFDLAQASPELRKAIGERPPLNIFRMLPHAGPAAERFLGLGAALLRESELDPQLRELVIIRVGVLCRAEYEVHQHIRLARRAGVAQEKIDALRDGPDAAAFSKLERAALRYADQVVLNVKAGASTFNAIADNLSHREMAELTLIIGYYMMVSRFLENFEVELEHETPAE